MLTEAMYLKFADQFAQKKIDHIQLCSCIEGMYQCFFLETKGTIATRVRPDSCGWEAPGLQGQNLRRLVPKA